MLTDSDRIANVAKIVNELILELPSTDEVSDGFHTFAELYNFRMLYHAATLIGIPASWSHKSRRHSDGELCFGGGYFIVVTELPGIGQISNHYPIEQWDMFKTQAKEIADEWDGHTVKDVIDRLTKYIKANSTYSYSDGEYRG